MHPIQVLRVVGLFWTHCQLSTRVPMTDVLDNRTGFGKHQVTILYHRRGRGRMERKILVRG